MKLSKEQKFYSEIVQKAWEDSNFKSNLVANPVNTIEEFTGQKLSIPEGKTLVVRDLSENTSTVYFDIPDPQNIDDIELTEEQLEQAAGGISGTQGCTCTPGLLEVLKPS